MTSFLKPNETLLSRANMICVEIKNSLGFTVNIGLSSNKLLAKMASDFEKPDKIHTLYPHEIATKMWCLPVSELFMVGKRSINKLNKIGIYTIGDLATINQSVLIKLFGKYGKVLWEYANGIDNTEVIKDYVKPKGISNSVTLPYDVSDIEKLNEVLLALAEHVCYRLRSYNLLAMSISVQLKTNEFKVFSHQRKLLIATDSTKVIYHEAKLLLGELYQKQRIRLVGMRISNFIDKNEMQLSLFDLELSQKQKNIDITLDRLKKKYGYNKITKAGKMNIDGIVKFE